MSFADIGRFSPAISKQLHGKFVIFAIMEANRTYKIL